MKPYHFLQYFIVLFSWSCHSGASRSQTAELDSAMKAIPANIDTTILVKDDAGAMLQFRQYLPVLLRNEGMLYRAKETLRLQRFTKTAIDSLNNDDYAIARWDRWAAIRDKQPKSFDKVFRNVADVLATADSVIVYKSTRTMYLRRKGKNLFQFRINLGGHPQGNKISDGDSRTPEGVYYLDNKTDRNDKYYKSFWISYPNQDDRALALKKGVKPGVGIMIHGTPPERTNSKDWTNGCIALSNNDMDILFKHVMPGTLIDIRK